MAYGRTPADRARGAIATAVAAGLIGAALLLGLRGAGAYRDRIDPGLAIFTVAPPTPPPPVRAEHHRRTPRREAAAAPPAKRATPTDLVAPTPVVPLPVPPPLVTAPLADTARAPTVGAALAGPGQGAGGEGNGRGSGDGGNGDGGGGGETPPRWRHGRLKNSDFPAAAADAGASGTVGVRYVVRRDGRVEDCEVTHSSGSRVLDATTCRLIEQRFRFSPSRDAAGRPVDSMIVENHGWFIHDDPPAPTPPRAVR